MKLRVLQYIETGGPGGAETIFLALSKELQRRGHHVSAAVGTDDWLATQLRQSKISVVIIHSRGSFDFGTIRSLNRAIKDIGADVVHAHLFEGAVYAGMAGLLSQVPVVMTLHGQVDIKEAGARMQAKSLIIRSTVKRVIAVSKSLQDELSSALRLSYEQCIVIPNGVHSRESGTLTARVHTNTSPIVIAVGNIRRPKGYPVLLEAIAKLKVTFPEILLRILGQSDFGPLIAELKDQVIRLGLQRNVEFAGFIDDPFEHVANANCFVLSSYQEGFSLATIEAMIAGTPVVATKCGGPEEFIVDGETGILVPVADAEALATGISKVITSRELSAKLAKNAYTMASKNYSLSVMVDAYEREYQEILS